MLEIACFNVQSACLAQEARVDRIEFCAEYEIGGVTPHIEDLILLRSKVDLPVFIMIRPRGGSFVYSDNEMRTMSDDIQRLKDLADGFVFGVLDESGKVDVERNTQLVALANPKQCTFHRAIDQTPDLFQAVEEVIHCGFHTVLTSGAQASAIQGAETISRLVKRYKDSIEIMAGGGVRSSNIEYLKSMAGSQWLHSSAIISNGEVADENEMRRLKAHS